MLKIVDDLIPIDKVKQRPRTKLDQVDSITIHWVGPFPGQTPKIVRDYWIDSDVIASAHFIIKDDLVLRAIPETEVAWHCGNAYGNRTSIGIEVIPANTDGMFSEASIASLKSLLELLPNVPLKRHYDWTEKDCPRYYTPKVADGDRHWEDLVTQVRHG